MENERESLPKRMLKEKPVAVRAPSLNFPMGKFHITRCPKLLISSCTLFLH